VGGFHPRAAKEVRDRHQAFEEPGLCLVQGRLWVGNFGPSEQSLSLGQYFTGLHGGRPEGGLLTATGPTLDYYIE
jgi:hypothetical protein